MPAFDYTSRDYLSIRQDLINRATSIIPEWDATDASEFGNVFVDLWAYMGDILHFYVDRAASETFLDTATQRDSVMAIANLLDYVPASPRAARGSVVMSLSAFPETSIKSVNITSALISTVDDVSQVTFTTATAHNLTAGQLVSIGGTTPSTFNISDVVISGIESTTKFRVLVSSYTSAPSGTATGRVLNYNLAYTVPQYTTLTAYDSNNNTYNFYLNSASAPLTKVNSQVTGTIVQGTIVSNESLGTSTGAPNQTLVLVKKNVDISSISIQVQEGPISGGSPTLVTYQYVENISSANYLEKVFTARVKSSGYTQVIFGNGFNGSIPTTNANIIASYRTTDGSLGNLPANSVRFINGLPSSYVNIESSSATSGGADIESISSIKNNVSRLYRTQDRAVSLQDYKDLCLQISGVSKATAVFGASSSKTIATSTVNTTHLTVNTSVAHKFVAGQTVTLSGISQSSHNIASIVIREVPTATSFTVLKSDYPSAPTGSGTGGTATANDSTVILYTVPHQTSYPPAPVTSGGVQKVVVEIPTTMVESVESYFSKRSMVGVTAQVINPPDLGTIEKYIECTPVYVGMIVHVRNNFVQSWVKSDIDKAIRDLLTFPKTFFGQKLTIGEVYRAALSVEGVDYVELTTLDTNYDSTPSTVGTVGDITADAYKLLCFSNEMDYPSYPGGAVVDAPAISLHMLGGITGSN